MDCNWMHKWLNDAKTTMLLANKKGVNNVIFTVEGLRNAVNDKRTVYRVIPLDVMKRILADIENGVIS